MERGPTDGAAVPLQLAALLHGIVAGEYDHLPEQAFYMVGSIDEAVEKGSKL